MNLAQLCFVLGGKLAGNKSDVSISGLCCDSRVIQAGDLFFAVNGVNDDGAKYAAAAVSLGAVGVVCERAIDLPVAQIIVPDVREAMAVGAGEFYQHPSRKLGLIGITGTNGKTTIAYIIRHLLRCCDYPCGMLGTVEYDLLGESNPSPLTTPQSIDFHRYLDRINQNGGRYCVAEVSSHALVQQRVEGADFSAAVFTNLTQDHLDYHGDLEAYAQAKARLFTMLNSGAFAVVNGDDVYCNQVLRSCRANIISFGRGDHCDVRIVEVDCDADGSTVRLDMMGGDFTFHTPLCGDYNVYNSVAALLTVAELGLGLKKAADYFDKFTGVPGRLQRFTSDNGVAVFVDYAHTPDALQKALLAVKPLCKRKLRVVFGCGGDRDAGKRPQMGRAACELADQVYVTSDNPRTEDPQQILCDILSGLDGFENFCVEPDRSAAISMAVNDSRAGDIVLVAGKGHEDYQIIGTKKIHFDDREVVRKILGQPPFGRDECA